MNSLFNFIAACVGLLLRYLQALALKKTTVKAKSTFQGSAALGLGLGLWLGCGTTGGSI